MLVKYRKLVYSLCALLVAASVIAWAATGMAYFTRFPDTELEQANQSNELGDLFSDTGINESHGNLETVESKTTIGLLPAPTASPEAISVISISVPAIALAGLTLFLTKRRSH